MPPHAEIDTTAPFRSMSRLADLVRYVLATSADNETDWIEWKCDLDLTKAAGRFAAAKQILGFGNRDPGRAASHGDGCAFMVLGAEPGNLAGQPPMDPSKLEAAIRPYVGTDGPAWLPQTVDVDGVPVVVITVEPPRWGDPIHTLRKEFSADDRSGAEEGKVFVRRPGGTHPASSGELKALQMRLLNQPAEVLAVVIESIGAPIPRIDVGAHSVEAWVGQERALLLAPLEAAEAKRLAEEGGSSRSLTASEAVVFAPALDAISKATPDLMRLHRIFGGDLPEDRTAENYRAEVESYLADASDVVAAQAFNGFEEVVGVPLALQVINTSDRNLESVEIVVSFAGPVLTYEEYDVDLPARPRFWGPRPNPQATGNLLRSSQFRLPPMPVPSFQIRSYRAKNTGSTTIEFDPFDLRPHKEYGLEPIPLAVGAQLNGSIEASWSATAKNRDGRAEGSVTVQLSDEVFTIQDLL